MSNLYDSLFLESEKTERIVGTIIALSSVGYSVETIGGGGVIQVRGDGYNVGDQVLVEDRVIVQKLAHLELVEVVI